MEPPLVLDRLGGEENSALGRTLALPVLWRAWIASCDFDNNENGLRSILRSCLSLMPLDHLGV